MALLSDRSSFDRLICQRIYFADAVEKLACRVSDDAEAAAIRAYAKWRAFDDSSILDDCFVDVASDRWQEIIDAVNSLWEDARP